MYTVIGITAKGERFAIGHTTSKKKAEKVVDDINAGFDNEFVNADAYFSRSL